MILADLVTVMLMFYHMKTCFTTSPHTQQKNIIELSGDLTEGAFLLNNNKSEAKEPA